MKIFRNKKHKIVVHISKELGPLSQKEHLDKCLFLMRNGASSGVVIDKDGNKIVTYKKG